MSWKTIVVLCVAVYLLVGLVRHIAGLCHADVLSETRRWFSNLCPTWMVLPLFIACSIQRTC
jgi:uncharacterized membrane protein YecN with MAPEG domain